MTDPNPSDYKDPLAYLEDKYREHVANEHWEWDDDFEAGDSPGHPDGCFWCGGHGHPSSSCSQREEFYR